MNLANNNIKNGLTLRQWIVLCAAFMLGVGGVYVVRDIFPPQSAHAAVIQRPHTVPVHIDKTAD